MYGLLERDFKFIFDAFGRHPEIEEAIIFGSRAMGNFKKGSDVDIAIKGRITKNVVLQLLDELNEEYPLPYFSDVVNYNEISNMDLKAHIDTVGKLIYP